MAIPTWLYVWMNQARSDLVYATRNIASQVRHSESRETSGLLLTRYRFPEGDPSEQAGMFEGLCKVLRRLEPDAARYGSRGNLKVGGLELPARTVVLAGRDRNSGENLTLTLSWVRFKANWFIHGYSLGDS